MPHFKVLYAYLLAIELRMMLLLERIYIQPQKMNENLQF